MANTPEYRTILQLTSELTTAFENDLIKLGGELLAQGLIASNNAADVRNPHNNAGHRAAILMGCIRNRIELDPKGNYQVFINVLKQRVADHKEILQMLDGKYKELGGTLETGIAAALEDMSNGSEQTSVQQASSVIEEAEGENEADTREGGTVHKRKATKDSNEKEPPETGMNISDKKPSNATKYPNPHPNIPGGDGLSKITVAILVLFGVCVFAWCFYFLNRG